MHNRYSLKEVRFLLTTACNLKCTYCYVTKLCTSASTMPLDMADKVMDFIDSRVSEGTKITFFGGEPLMCFDIIKHCVEKFPTMDYGMSTNGVLIDEEKLEFFKKHKNFFKVQISLDGTIETQFKNRGACPDLVIMRDMLRDAQSTVRMVASEPEKIYENVRFLVALGAKEINIGIPIFSENVKGYKKEYAKQLELVQTDFSPVKISGDRLGCEQACYAVNDHIAVAPNGDIYPCDMFYFKDMFKFGSVTEGIDPRLVKKFQEEMEGKWDPDVPCLAHKLFMKDKWINEAN